MIAFVIDNHRLYLGGKRFFYSELELRSKFPCKLYKIDETFEAVQEDHSHDYIQIWYVNKGEFIHCINNQKYKMVKGNLFVIPPFAIHRVECLPGKELEIIGCEFTPNFINDRYRQSPVKNDFFDYAYLEQFLTAEDKVKPKITLTGSIDHQVSQLLYGMLEEYTARDSYYELMIKGSLLKLLSVIIRAYREDAVKEMGDKADKYRPLIKAAIDYMHQHYDQEIRLDQMCKITMLSKTYFCDLFKHLTGKTFNDYLINLRIKKSTELLVQANLTITDVCFQVGFNDLTYFSRIFKKHTGISPSYYKKYAASSR
ncbi:AraC family transcriptional regulator [Paenibacillus sp. MBLB4367]|uniref:AraC family transcriptional regulator n=1 Tax=Paenibacillus sp. MBLB4367 TaxID=3384767 RepID=UPI003907EA56